MEEGRLLAKLDTALLMRTLDYFEVLKRIGNDGVDAGVTVPVVIAAEDQQLIIAFELTADVAKLFG